MTKLLITEFSQPSTKQCQKCHKPEHTDHVKLRSRGKNEPRRWECRRCRLPKRALEAWDTLQDIEQKFILGEVSISDVRFHRHSFHLALYPPKLPKEKTPWPSTDS